jgi:hypothetical protein
LEDLSQEVTFLLQGMIGGWGVSLGKNLGKNTADTVWSKCKGPEVGMSWLCLRINKAGV